MTERPRKVTFRLSENELERLHALSNKAGYPMEQYLRSLIKGVVPQERPPPDYHAMMNELNAIGVNLNQIARRAHVLEVVDAQRYDEEVRKLNAAVSRINDAVRLPRRL